jgi:hypothetical protein
LGYRPIWAGAKVLIAINAQQKRTTPIIMGQGSLSTMRHMPQIGAPANAPQVKKRH